VCRTLRRPPPPPPDAPRKLARLRLMRTLLRGLVQSLRSWSVPPQFQQDFRLPPDLNRELRGSPLVAGSAGASWTSLVSGCSVARSNRGAASWFPSTSTSEGRRLRSVCFFLIGLYEQRNDRWSSVFTLIRVAFCVKSRKTPFPRTTKWLDDAALILLSSKNSSSGRIDGSWSNGFS